MSTAASPGAQTQREQVPVRGHLWPNALKLLALVVIAVVVVAVLRTKFPNPAEFWNALRQAQWGWVIAAFALEGASIGMMVRQQGRLLRAFGVRVSLGRIGLITYSSTAITMSVPGGGAVSAGYTYRKFRTSGANAATATSVMVLSGVLSVLALTLLYLVGLLIASWTQLVALGREHPLVTTLIGLGVLALIVGAIKLLGRRRRNPMQPSAPTPRLDALERKHPKLGAAGRQALQTFYSAGAVRPADWNIALGQSLLNWLLDAASLYAATRAFALDIDLWKLALLYLGIQIVRQIPVSPGGIGLIEASLLAGLVSAGAAQGPAAAAIVVYRLFSCWLLIPIGFATMGALELIDRRRDRHGKRGKHNQQPYQRPGTTERPGTDGTDGSNDRAGTAAP